MWVYEQDTGWLCYGGARIAKGYAGAPGFINAHPAQELHNQGPLPCGTYTMGSPCNHPILGTDAIPLTPHPENRMFGRTGFYIHADWMAHCGQGSTGCICLPAATRQLLMTSTDKALSVQLSPQAIQGATP